MCSNMWARPVIPVTSWTDPTLTWVKKEKTGASGRSMISTVRPLGSFLTVIRFSKEATSWARTIGMKTRKQRQRVKMREQVLFIVRSQGTRLKAGMEFFQMRRSWRDAKTAVQGG